MRTKNHSPKKRLKVETFCELFQKAIIFNDKATIFLGDQASLLETPVEGWVEFSELGLENLRFCHDGLAQKTLDYGPKKPGTFVPHLPVDFGWQAMQPFATFSDRHVVVLFSELLTFGFMLK